MSITTHAAKIIHHMAGDLQRAHDVAAELAAAGLLASDSKEWPSNNLTPSDVRQIAYSLLADADYQEATK